MITVMATTLLDEKKKISITFTYKDIMIILEGLRVMGPSNKSVRYVENKIVRAFEVRL